MGGSPIRPLKRHIKPTASSESDAYIPSKDEPAFLEDYDYNFSENEAASLESSVSRPSENEALQSPRKKRATKAKLFV